MKGYLKAGAAFFLSRLLMLLAREDRVRTFLQGCSGLACALLLPLTGCLSTSLSSIQITPGAGSQSAAVGQTVQFKALGVYTEANHATRTQDITNLVNWTSANPGVATIGSNGLATAVSAGTTGISASMEGSFGDVVGTSNLTVTGSSSSSSSPVLTSLAIIPGSQTVTAVGETAQFIAIGTYTGGSPVTQDLTSQVTWQTSDAKVVQVDQKGVATGVGPGTATITGLITATDGSVISASSTFTEQAGAVLLPTLTVYEVGSGSGSVTANGVIDCGSGVGCVGNFPVGTVVTLVATPSAGSSFGGWSANCTPVAGKTNECTITMSSDDNSDAVGAIFDAGTL